MDPVFHCGRRVPRRTRIRGYVGLLAVLVHLFGRPGDSLNEYVFPSAVTLAKGRKVASAPIYMGSLYTSLDEYVANVMWSLGRYVVCRL